MAKYKPLIDNMIYDIVLDKEQIILRDNILDDDKLIIFVNAVAGTGKTTIATACANLLVEEGKYRGILYIAAPTQEQKQGYLKGSLEEKSEPYFAPFYEALETIGVNLNTCKSNDIKNKKNGTDYVECVTHTFQRGTNLSNKVIIVDEAQNFYVDELKKVLTRVIDDCKVIVIGHTGQIDLYKNPHRSGFARYIEWFRDDPRTAICNLSTNHRGWISSHADAMPDDYNPDRTVLVNRIDG